MVSMYDRTIISAANTRGEGLIIGGAVGVRRPPWSSKDFVWEI